MSTMAALGLLAAADVHSARLQLIQPMVALSSSTFTSSVTVVNTAGFKVSTKTLDVLDASDTTNNRVGVAVAPTLARLEVKSTGNSVTQPVQIWRNSANVVVSSMASTGVLSTCGGGNFSKLPSGTVIFATTTFSPGATACPAGWSDMSAVWGGRYLVAAPNNVMASVGTLLGDREVRPVGQHNHRITEGDHAHTVNYLASTDNRNATSMSFSATQNSGSASVGLTVLNTNCTGCTTAGPNAPYIQLTVCKKD